jgi:hypothetical protein
MYTMWNRFAKAYTSRVQFEIDDMKNNRMLERETAHIHEKQDETMREIWHLVNAVAKRPTRYRTPTQRDKLSAEIWEHIDEYLEFNERLLDPAYKY